MLTWEALQFKRDADVPRRLRWQPYGDLDFLDVPTDIREVNVQRYGVYLLCMDGVYRLNSDTFRPSDRDQWRVTRVFEL